MSADLNPVVILNMHYTGLGIARNLSDQAMEIYGISAQQSLYGNYSRHCKFLAVLDTEREPQACLDYLREFAQQQRLAPILLPTRDHDLFFLCRYEAELSDYILPYASLQNLATILQKDRVLELAREIGISCPASIGLNSLANFHVRESEFTFPCIAKPKRAADWRKPGVWEKVGRRKAIKLESLQDLRDLYAAIHEVSPEMDVQEYIEGEDDQLVIFGSFHKPETDECVYFTGRKLVQYPAQSGTGVAVRSEVIGGIVAPSRQLLRKLEYYGVSEIEYKYDAQRQAFRLIEINPRHWDQHYLGTRVGINLSRALYFDLIGARRTGESPRAEDKSYAWLADDSLLVSVLSNFKHRDYPFALYLKLLLKPKVWAVFSLRDIKPGLKLIQHLLIQYTDYAVKFLGKFFARKT